MAVGRPASKKADHPYVPFQIPLNGKMRTSVDPILLGEGDFSNLENIRYTDNGIRGIMGQTKAMASALPTTEIRSAHHFAKAYPSDESHFVMQAKSGSDGYVYDFTGAIGTYTGSVASTTLATALTDTTGQTVVLTDSTNFSSGDFVQIGSEIIQLGIKATFTYTFCVRGASGSSAATHTILSVVTKVLHKDAVSSSTARMSDAPDGCMAYCNGKESLLWGGNGIKVGRFINKSDEASRVSYGGNWYKCIKSHTSSTSVNRPGTGSAWQTYWEDTGSTGGAWADATYYNAAFYYDYTTRVNNNLNDAMNVAKLHSGHTDSTANDANTLVLLHLDDVSGNPVDSSVYARTITNLGVTYPDASPFWSPHKFGTFSAWFPPDIGTRFEIPDSADFNWSSSATYTVEGWILNSGWTEGQKTFFCQWTDDSNYMIMKFVVDAAGEYYNAAWEIVENVMGTPTTVMSLWSGPIAVNLMGAFHHIAFVENGDNFYIFYDGAVVANTTDTSRPQNYTQYNTVGSQYHDSVLGYHCYTLNCYLDEFRISNVARWTSNFTPPSSAYSSDVTTANTVEVYIGTILPATGFYYDINVSNTDTSTAEMQYWNGSAYVSPVGFVDGTSWGGVSLAVNGTMSFNDTSGVAKKTLVADVYLYWYRLVITGGVDTTTEIKQVYVKTAMQDVVDVWDGVYRPILSFIRNDGTKDIDETLNVREDSYLLSEASTFSTISSTTRKLHFGFNERAAGIRLNFATGSTNNNVVTLTVNYWDGESWVSAGAVTDGTSESLAPYSKSGVVTWTPPSEELEQKRTMSSTQSASLPTARHSGGGYGGDLYYYQLVISGAVDSTVLYYTEMIPAANTINAFGTCAMWQDRLWLANETSGYKNKLIGSAANTSVVFNGSDSPYFMLGDETEITAMKSMMNRYGGELSDVLLVCKKTETWIISGTGITENGKSTYGKYLISERHGCPAAGTLKVCDVGYEVAPGINKHIAIWLTGNGIVMYDQNSIVPIHGDIQNYFDDWRAERIDYTYVDDFYADYDSVNREYHLYVATKTGGGVLDKEFVYDVLRKKWFVISRGSKRLNGSTRAVRSDGYFMNYGFNSSGMIYALETGTTFDGTNITYKFKMAAKMLAGLMYQTVIRKIRLLTLSKDYT